MKKFTKWALALSLIALTLAAQPLAAATSTIYVVGTCKPSSHEFSHIQDALNFSPPPTTVQVCPGSYNEQVTITQPVNLQGISSGNGDQAVLSAAGGLTQTASSLAGVVYFQIWVNNVSGPVTISNITVDGAGNGVPSGRGFVAGIFVQNSPGSVSRATTRNQTGNGDGVGIMLEGGSATPTVSVNNNSVHDFDLIGIYSETINVGSSELTATISSNVVDSSLATYGIGADQGTTTTISGNFVTANNTGVIGFSGALGSITGNTIVAATRQGTAAGIIAVADGATVSGNKVFTTYEGIVVESSVATVQSNSIVDVTWGIDYTCNSNANVIHNTINDAANGIVNVPAALLVPNTYFNVPTIRSSC